MTIVARRHHLIASLSLLVGGFMTATPVGSATADEVKSATVELKDGTWKDVELLVEKSAGKVVIVDIWSTSCLPCMTEFPKLVELQKEHGEKLVCISFNVDYVGIKSKPPAFYRERVEKFLNEKKATFTNLLATVEADKVFESLELSSIPAVYVFGKDGKLAKRFDDSLLEEGEDEAFSYEHDINPFVAELLK